MVSSKDPLTLLASAVTVEEIARTTNSKSLWAEYLLADDVAVFFRVQVAIFDNCVDGLREA